MQKKKCNCSKIWKRKETSGSTPRHSCCAESNGRSRRRLQSRRSPLRSTWTSPITIRTSKFLLPTPRSLFRPLRSCCCQNFFVNPRKWTPVRREIQSMATHLPPIEPVFSYARTLRSRRRRNHGRRPSGAPLISSQGARDSPLEAHFAVCGRICLHLLSSVVSDSHDDSPGSQRRDARIGA